MARSKSRTPGIDRIMRITARRVGSDRVALIPKAMIRQMVREEILKLPLTEEGIRLRQELEFFPGTEAIPDVFTAAFGQYGSTDQ